VEFAMRCQYEIAQIEHAERMREADRFRRARMARPESNHQTAARKGRRFSFPRFQLNRPSEA